MRIDSLQYCIEFGLVLSRLSLLSLDSRIHLISLHYRVVNNDLVSELFSFAIWQLRKVRILRNVHNDRHSAWHPEASHNSYRCERCVQSELSDMCYQLKTMSLATLSLLTTLSLYFPSLISLDVPMREGVSNAPPTLKTRPWQVIWSVGEGK